jgi:phosphatidylglycerophosphate synthase
VAAAAELDAIVLADDPLARVRIAGLPAFERAVRVARRVGATRVLVVDKDRTQIATWRDGRRCPVLVLRADQLVHTPLAAPLVDALPSDGIAAAVGPDGAYAGAFVAVGQAAERAVAELAAGTRDAAIADTAEATRIPHGDVARHAIATREERRAAHALLYRILIKPQDNAITRYLYRPVSFPLTRLLVWTPITPNQISLLVAVMVAIGCWLTASASMNRVIAGTVLILAASYVDCCDGEIARLKLLSSRLGAWLDTIIDELSSVGYMVALGIHCHLYFGDRYGLELWHPAIVVGVITYGWSIYCVYYNIIVAVGSANSQDYVGRFEVVPGNTPGAVRLVPAAAKAITPKRPLPGWLQFLVTYLPYVVRRDFISWGAVILAVLHLTQVSFGLQVVGGVVSAAILTGDHLRLRAQRRAIRRAGQVLESPAT